MGKSGGKKKKAAAAASTLGGGGGDGDDTSTNTNTNTNSKNFTSSIGDTTSIISGSNNRKAAGSGANNEVSAAAVLLERAHEAKEEGNRRFQNKEYVGALEQYELALKLTPQSHPDRAVYHSNRAACLFQMKPVDYDAVIGECTLALGVQPRYPRALLRRSRALEAVGRYDAALHDAQLLLLSDPSNRDALDLASRLRSSLSQSPHSRPSPAALGASAVRGAPIAGLGPALPSRPLLQKTPPSPTPISSEPDKPTHLVSNGPNTPKPYPLPASLKPFKPPSLAIPARSPDKDAATSTPSSTATALAVSRWRPLKLVYDHDIRLAQMPENCSFRALREVISKLFPSSKSVLVKYRDLDGDLVTITGTGELRLAEACAEWLSSRKKKDGSTAIEKGSDELFVLRLHIVDVSPEQEPDLVEEDVEEEKASQEQEVPMEDGSIRGSDSKVVSSKGEPMSEGMDNGVVKGNTGGPDEAISKEQKARGDTHCHGDWKEVEIDDWLFDFAQLFRSHLGIDPDAHLDLHELGVELCSEALEETVTSEEVQALFDTAASKFQGAAALAFFNWGNVHMCAARKRIPLDDSAPKDLKEAQLQSTYDWVHERYSLAGQKYEEALRIKPDFYEGLLALGQHHFETAKLHWSFALVRKLDLSTWDATETIRLFNSAEEKMKAATKMWEQLEEQRANELKDPSASKKDGLLKRRKKQSTDTDGQPSANGMGELSADEATEQAAAMRSQIHLFWGNMLFERSQVELKLGINGWERNIDAAVERFKLAGASESDISVVLKNHASNAVDVDVDGKSKENINGKASENNHDDELKHASESKPRIPLQFH